MFRNGTEIFNTAIMKQEKSVLAPKDGMVERMLKFDGCQEEKTIPVKEEL